MNFNENIKNDRKIVKNLKKTNFRPKLSSLHFVIEPVISYGKFIDDLGLYEHYLICIFMNINEIDRN